jgi:hypothetical protein
MISSSALVSELKLSSSSTTRYCTLPATNTELPHVGITTLTLGDEVIVNVCCALSTAEVPTPVSQSSKCVTGEWQ